MESVRVIFSYKIFSCLGLSRQSQNFTATAIFGHDDRNIELLQLSTANDYC